MHTVVKKILIACLFLLPTLVFAEEKQPVDLKPVTPPQTVTATPAVPAVKPPEFLHATRIGSVDITRIGAESERGKALKTLLTAKKDKIQEKIDGKKKQLEKLEKSIKGKLATMTPKQREAKAKEFQKKVEEFQKIARSAEEEFYTLQEKETKALYEAIEKSAVEYGKANAFAAVIVRKEVLYLESGVDVQDVTEALIRALDQAGQKK